MPARPPAALAARPAHEARAVRAPAAATPPAQRSSAGARGSTRHRLPAYALYGEQHPALPDRLHCESIAERSRLHDWEIRPHRHEALCQWLVIVRGAAQVVLDGQPLDLQGPAVVTVPALAAHGFRFAPDIQGMVFTLAEPHLQTLLQPHPGLAHALLQPRAWPLPAGDRAAVPSAAVALQRELQSTGPWRSAAIDAALLRLAVAIARAAGQAGEAAAGHAAAPARALAHVQRLRALVEQQYRSQPTQAALAAQIGITPTQLNRACKRVLGHSAQGVLHARLLLQAQRELAYTRLSIKQIAFELGFVDAAYFTRFFVRGAGHTPTAWRAARHADPRR